MHDLRDVTFVMPVFIDTPERLRNLQFNLRHLTTLFKTNILVGEQSSTASEIDTMLSQALREFAGRIEYSKHNFTRQDFFQTHSLKMWRARLFSGLFDAKQTDHNFWHTRLVNRLVARVETPLMCSLDVDVIFPTSQYIEAVEMLRAKEADFSFPYGVTYLDIEPQHHDDLARFLIETPFDAEKTSALCARKKVRRKPHKGGAMFADTAIYRASGGENEHFFGWGPEDKERFCRFERLGLRSKRVEGDIYHLSHPRGATSSSGHSHFKMNHRELKRIKAMTRAQLQREVASWKWER